jgi:D-inositol-3-phosphate glycosyltransferase
MTKPDLRIAMISYHTCPVAALGGKNTGGMNVYVRELTRSLGARGVNVDVFTRSEDVHVPHVVHNLGYGNRVVHIPAGPERPIPKPDMAAYLTQFTENILNFSARKGIQYDLIHSHYWMSGIVARDLKMAWNVPIMHMFHTLGLMKNRIAGEGEYEGDYRIKGELDVLRNADRIVAATPAERAQLQWLYEVRTENVTIIPPGVDTTHFYPIAKDEARAYIEEPLDQNLLLFVGRIEPLKGVDVLLEAIALLWSQGELSKDQTRLAIIGGDADIPPEAMSQEMLRLHDMREALGIGELVTFMGKRDQDTLPYYYSAADVLIMPSHYESFGMVALEAMACGVPVVASQVGGLAFLVQDGQTGFLTPGNNPALLAEKLSLLLKDPALRVSLGANAVAVAQNYEWSRIAEQIEIEYRELIAQASK